VGNSLLIVLENLKDSSTIVRLSRRYANGFPLFQQTPPSSITKLMKSFFSENSPIPF